MLMLRPPAKIQKRLIRRLIVTNGSQRMKRLNLACRMVLFPLSKIYNNCWYSNMEIGIPKEIIDKEFRVGATPEMVHALVQAGHVVLVETQAGEAIGFTDEMYKGVGAK